MAARNNIARLPWELREIVCRMLLDGAAYDDVRAAVASEAEKLGIEVGKLHNTSFLAYRKSAEFARYCDLRRQWDERTEKRRWAAKIVRDADGPNALADIAEIEILEQLHDLAAGGALETGKDVATVARAITAMQRTQLARMQAERDARIAELEKAHAAKVAELEAEIARLRAQLEEKTGSKQVDAGKVADALDEVLGVK